MKLTIMGFSQRKLIEYGLDTIDALILRWILDFYHSKNMMKINFEDKEYIWVNYKHLLENLPILNIAKDTLYRRLKKICQAQVLECHVVKFSGSYSYYRFTEKLDSLLRDTEIPSDLNPTHTEKNPYPYGKKSVPGTEKNPDLIDKSIKYNYSYIKQEKKTNMEDLDEISKEISGGDHLELKNIFLSNWETFNRYFGNKAEIPKFEAGEKKCYQTLLKEYKCNAEDIIEVYKLYLANDWCRINHGRNWKQFKTKFATLYYQLPKNTKSSFLESLTSSEIKTPRKLF